MMRDRYEDGSGVPFTRGAVEYQILRAREEFLTASARLEFLHRLGIHEPLSIPGLPEAVRSVVAVLEKVREE